MDRANRDTGQVLAERDMNVAHPPPSTIKTLLVVTALDELPNLDATVIGTEADTHVGCSCVGIGRAVLIPRASSSTRSC